MKTDKYGLSIFAIFAVIALMLSACGGGNENSQPSFGISGQVTSNGMPLSGVSVTLGGATSATANTDASGNYFFSNLINGNYIIAPGEAGLTFTPANSQQTINNQNIAGINFTGSPSIQGGTTVVAGETTQNVISQQESQQGFKDVLEITNIVHTTAFGGPPSPLLSGCSFNWTQSEMVIISEDEWNSLRSDCFFSVFSSQGNALPNIDFTSNMALVSMQNIEGQGTQIVAVLEFDSKVIVVINDNVSSLPPPAFGYPFNIVSVPIKVLPIDFIRVENILSPS